MAPALLCLPAPAPALQDIEQQFEECVEEDEVGFSGSMDAGWCTTSDSEVGAGMEANTICLHRRALSHVHAACMCTSI